MRRRRFIILVLSLLFTLVYVQGFNVPTVEASTIYQGDLVLTGNNVTTIEGRFDINGSIYVEDNATLILQNAVLNFTQTNSFQYRLWLRANVQPNPKLFAYNSTITANQGLYVQFGNNSTATINNCTIGIPITVQAFHHSNISISNSYIRSLEARQSSILNINNLTNYLFKCFESSKIQIQDSEIANMYLNLYSINCSIFQIEPDLMDNWNFLNDCSVNIQSGGEAPNMTIVNTNIDYWSFQFYGTSNATITNSTTGYLRAWYDSTCYLHNTACSGINVHHNGTVWLFNSTYSYTDLFLSGKVYVSWYLDVYVVDSIDQAVPSASVSVSYLNSTLVDSKQTDANGLARFSLMEKMMNDSGVRYNPNEYPIGDYGVEASYESYLSGTTVNLTETKQVTLTLGNLVIPELSSIVLISAFIILTIIVVIVNRRKQ